MEEKQQHIDIVSELNNRIKPNMEYLIENRKNHDKFNTCLDIAGENIRFLESVINCAQGYIKDLKTLKGLIVAHENAYKRKELHQELQNDEKTILGD